MKLYFAGITSVSDSDMLEQSQVESVLISFAYILKLPKIADRWIGRDLLVDSGGFSAKTLGLTIDLEQYAAYIKEKGITQYANFDIIGDYRATRRNQEKLEAMGLNPIPVVHVGCPTDELKAMLKQYDYIAIGGLVPYARQCKVLQELLNQFWAVIRDYWPKKIHGFGMTSRFTMLNYSWYSVDSTSYLSSRRFGNSSDPALCDKTNLFRRTARHWKYRQLHEVEYFKKLQKEMTQIWTRRNITWEEAYEHS